MIALLAGLVFNLFRPDFRGSLYVKLSLVCLLSLFICTIGINTTGFYFYFQVGFSPKFTNTFPIPSVQAPRIGGMSVTVCLADRYGTASPIIPFCLRLFPY
ncbi:MAG: hypothetical protein ACLRSW_08250 [Christensenellaceae bacterium]